MSLRSVLIFSVVLLALLAVTSAATTEKSRQRSILSTRKTEGVNGGVPCAACTVVFEIFLQWSGLHPMPIDHALQSFCTLFPDPVKNSCIVFIDKFGPLLIRLLSKNVSSDKICQQIGVCTNPSCRLFPAKTNDALFNHIQQTPIYVPAEMSVWGWLENLINKWANEHEPIDDLDHDFFASIQTFRGSDWRGRDCDDLSNVVYPGRMNSTLPALFDHNCNGIKGSDLRGRSYESLYCDNTSQRGFIGLGDSATAHFRLPPQYFNASEYDGHTFNHLLFLLENEGDWPHRSWGSGHLNDTTGDCEGPLQSIYLQLLERNRCIFRDYQNIGVNGARTGSMAPPGIINSMARDQNADHPALVFYALIGNDVCHGDPSFDPMTTPQQFEENVLQSLNYLDTRLPNGSHVVFVGLVDGRVLWDVMNNRTHPIGCTYAELYDYLNCLQISPCWGWMNSNATVRNMTWDRAQQLNAVYPDIISKYQFKNFDMAYYEFPIVAIMAYYEKNYPGKLYQLIEPVDGFHPSQIANALTAQFLFDALLKQHPDFIGPINPNNKQIISMFGDQGGY